MRFGQAREAVLAGDACSGYEDQPFRLTRHNCSDARTGGLRWAIKYCI